MTETEETVDERQRREEQKREETQGRMKYRVERSEGEMERGRQ